MPKRRVRRDEPLAILATAVDDGAIVGSGVDPEGSGDTEDGIAVVPIRGALIHHPEDGFGDSYDSIVERVRLAAESASTVVLLIDSPGGMVAGLFGAVESIRMACAGKRLVAYVDGAGCSAAYALACAADEIVAAPTAVLGSIGVITCLASQAEANARAGVHVEIVSSGARKADGHPDAPITDDALAVAQARVDTLAGMFFELVADVRGLDAGYVQSLEAGTYLGAESIDVGLADSCLSWSAFIDGLREVKASANTETQTEEEDPMRAKLEALIKTLSAELAAAPREARKALSARIAKAKTALASLDAAAAVLAEGEDAPSDESEGEEKDEEAEDKKDGEGEEEKDSSEKMVAAKDLSALVERHTGLRGKAAVGGVASILSQHKALVDRVAALEEERETAAKLAQIDGALRARRITPAEAKELASESAEMVAGYLKLRKHAVVKSASEPNTQPGAVADGDAAQYEGLLSKFGLDGKRKDAALDQIKTALAAERVEKGRY